MDAQVLAGLIAGFLEPRDEIAEAEVWAGADETAALVRVVTQGEQSLIVTVVALAGGE